VEEPQQESLDEAPAISARPGLTDMQRLGPSFGGSVGNRVELYDWYVHQTTTNPERTHESAHTEI
jgi:hypothetical protein